MPTGDVARWTIEAPTSLEFDDVTGLRIRLIAGSVAVLATDGKPSLDVSSVEGDPLTVTYDGGVLTIAHENLTWEGLLKWLRPQRHSATVTVTVPRKCPTQVGVVSATAVMSGISSRASVKSVSGGITLDGITGDVDANTVSGALEAQGINGRLNFRTVSGDLTLADGWLERAMVDCRSRSWTLMALHDIPNGAMAHLDEFLARLKGGGFELTQEFPPDCLPIVEGKVILPLEPYETVG